MQFSLGELPHLRSPYLHPEPGNPGEDVRAVPQQFGERGAAWGVGRFADKATSQSNSASHDQAIKYDVLTLSFVQAPCKSIHAS